MGERKLEASEASIFLPDTYKARRWVYKRKGLLNNNYPQILKVMSLIERDWAERFEAFQYSIETGWGKDARRLFEELRGYPVNHSELLWIGKAVDIKYRANPRRVESGERWARKHGKTDRRRVKGRYTSNDYVVPRLASPEDDYIQVIDIAKRQDLDLEGYFARPDLWTKERGSGRPKKETE